MKATLGKPRDLKWPDHIDPSLHALTWHPNFSVQLEQDIIEIPAVEDREGYNPGADYLYWLTGFGDYLAIKETMNDYLDHNLNILDFGGSSGRVSRHFLASQPGSKITIAEVNQNYVDWVNEFGGENLSAVAVSQPSIPAADHTFDFIFGISVFTHIDLTEFDWLRELIRVVKPGGYIYLTILSEHSWSVMPPDELLNTIKRHVDLAPSIGLPMPKERFSVQLEYNRPTNNCNTFCSSEYVKREWSKVASVERILHARHGVQSAVILRRI
jgi:ubiquinone/menaquinone biosynthesis C-methylase UbiE